MEAVEPIAPDELVMAVDEKKNPDADAPLLDLNSVTSDDAAALPPRPWIQGKWRVGERSGRIYHSKAYGCGGNGMAVDHWLRTRCLWFGRIALALIGCKCSPLYPF